MPRPAHFILAAATALLGLGLIMVHSAGASVHAPADPVTLSLPGLFELDLGLMSMFWTRHLAYAAAAIAVMLIAFRFPADGLIKGWGPFRLVVLLLAIALVLQALTLVPGVGVRVNGAARWLRLGPMTFQPSELVKWAMVIALAGWCAWRAKRPLRQTAPAPPSELDAEAPLRGFLAGFLPAAGLLAFACGLIVLEDLGTAVLIGGVGLVLLIAGGVRWWHAALVLPGAAVAVLAAIVTSPYRVNRLTTFLDPWADPVGAGYHPIQSLLAFAQGGLLGQGLGMSIQKYYLPEDTTDFIYPILVEELGFAGGAAVVGLYLVILLLGLGIVMRCRDRFGQLLGLGILLTLGIQAVINLAVVTVVAPTKGIALPLVSAGGTGWVLTAAMLGLLASLDREPKPTVS